MQKHEELAFALAQLDRTQAFHGRIETRSNFLLALNAVIATITIINFPKPLFGDWTAVPGLFTLAANLAAFGSIIAAFYSHLENKVRPSMLYFGDIARIPSDAYIANVRAASESELIEDALCQTWRNSEILVLKYQFLKWAFAASCGAILCWSIFLFLVMWHTGALPMLTAG